MSLQIVGIGASAGGLESFRTSWRVPTDTGMAYVFVQHLDPGHASLLVEILSKRAEFPVEQAREGAKIFPDHLYVITPNTTLTLGGGVLHLRNRDPLKDPIVLLMRFSIRLLKREGPMPLALFSLEWTDGAKGIQAVKQAGGITFAQDKSSALFYGMPNSAIRTGCEDFILSPGDIALELINISRHLDFRGTNPDC